MPQDANDLLMGGGTRSAKFEKLGDTVVGTIVDDPRAVQMTKYQSSELDYWPSGDPKMQIVVIIATDTRDPADPQDDGRRRLHIPPRMMPPVREAVQRSGAKGLAAGGRIAVRWYAGTGQGEGNPKQYQADYAPPAVDPGSLLASATPATLPPPSAQAVPSAPPPTTPLLAAAAPTASTAPPPPTGVDPTLWATLPEAQRQAVLAAMANPAAHVPPF